MSHLASILARSDFGSDAGGIPIWFILIFGGIVVAIIVGAVMAYKAGKKRREALRAWAEARSLAFHPDDDSGVEHEFPQFSCLQQGSNRYGYNRIQGLRKDRLVDLFDYHYETHSTDSKGNRQTHHHHFSVVILDTGHRLKKLSIRTEGFLDKMKGAFGFDDIDFESAEFSRKFWVTAEEKRWAYDVIHQETMELLLHSPRFKIEFSGPYVIAYRSKRFKLPDFDHAFELVEGILDRLPKDIVKDLRSRPPALPQD